MILSPYIQERLKGKCGIDLREPADAERLVLDIEKTTGEHIGVNTIKRMLGMIAAAIDSRHRGALPGTSRLGGTETV